MTSIASSSVERRQDRRAGGARAWSCRSRAGRRSRRLWPPAAATSSARLASGWPRTSARSPADARGVGEERGGVDRGRGARRARRAGGDRVGQRLDADHGGPPASAASPALTGGHEQAAQTRAARAAAAIGSAPRTACTRPSSPSSPSTHHAAQVGQRRARPRPRACRARSAGRRARPPCARRPGRGSR